MNERRHPPCEHLEFDESKGRNVRRLAAVDCSRDCLNCGWAPEEQRRRLTEGCWVFGMAEGEDGVTRPVRILKFRPWIVKNEKGKENRL